jgi:hypothetical protein
VDRFGTRRTAGDRFGTRRTAAGQVAAWRVGWAVARGPVARQCRAAVVHSRPEHPGEPATAVPAAAAGAPTRGAEKAASSRRWPATCGVGSWSPASRPADRAERQRAGHRPVVHRWAEARWAEGRWTARRRAGPREVGQAAVGSTTPAWAGSCSAVGLRSTAGVRPAVGLVAPGWPMPGPAGHRLAAAGSATHPPVAECRGAVDRAVERRPGCRAAVWPRAGRCRTGRCQGARCRIGRCQAAHCRTGRCRPPPERRPAERRPAEQHPLEQHPIEQRPLEQHSIEQAPLGPEHRA